MRSWVHCPWVVAVAIDRNAEAFLVRRGVTRPRLVLAGASALFKGAALWRDAAVGGKG